MSGDYRHGCPACGGQVSSLEDGSWVCNGDDGTRAADWAGPESGLVSVADEEGYFLCDSCGEPLDPFSSLDVYPDGSRAAVPGHMSPDSGEWIPVRDEGTCTHLEAYCGACHARIG